MNLPVLKTRKEIEAEIVARDRAQLRQWLREALYFVITVGLLTIVAVTLVVMVFGDSHELRRAFSDVLGGLL